MGRKPCRPAAATEHQLETCQAHCWVGGDPMWVAYTKRRQLMTLAGLIRLQLPVRRCRNPTCARYRRPYRPEAEGTYALPRGEFGLDVIALVGTLRFAQHRAIPEIHAELTRRGVAICERSVTAQLYRYEELLALRLTDQQRLRTLLRKQGLVVLALDGLQPDVGMRCSGCCATASRGRSCSPAACSAPPKPIWCR